jgi:hypothetical protein
MEGKLETDMIPVNEVLGNWEKEAFATASHGVPTGFTIPAKYYRNFRNIAFFAEVRKKFISVKIFRLNSSSSPKLHQTTLK